MALTFKQKICITLYILTMAAIFAISCNKGKEKFEIDDEMQVTYYQPFNHNNDLENASAKAYLENQKYLTNAENDDNQVNASEKVEQPITEFGHLSEFAHLPQDSSLNIDESIKSIFLLKPNSTEEKIELNHDIFHHPQGWWQDAINCEQTGATHLYCKPKEKWVWPY